MTKWFGHESGRSDLQDQGGASVIQGSRIPPLFPRASVGQVGNSSGTTHLKGLFTHKSLLWCLRGRILAWVRPKKGGSLTSRPLFLRIPLHFPTWARDSPGISGGTGWQSRPGHQPCKNPVLTECRKSVHLCRCAPNWRTDQPTVDVNRQSRSCPEFPARTVSKPLTRSVLREFCGTVRRFHRISRGAQPPTFSGTKRAGPTTSSSRRNNQSCSSARPPR